MPFDFYNEFYGTYIGISIRGAIGKKYIYQRVNNQQKKYSYVVPSNPNTIAQQKMRDLLKKATLSWHTLSSDTKKWYDEHTPPRRTMSGFNFYVSRYINTYK